MIYNFRKKDILIIFTLCLPKFVIGFLGCMLIPIFPSLVDIHFPRTMANNTGINMSIRGNTTSHNYYQLSILFVTKSLCQIIIGPLAGYFINLLGAMVVLLIGVIFQILTILFFGIGNAYYLLIIGRVFEAFSATAVNAAPAAYIAIRFKDHKQRGFVYGVNGLCLCVGAAGGPAFGGYVYEFYGKAPAFLAVLSFVFIELIFVILVIIQEKKPKKNPKTKSTIDKENNLELLNSPENIDDVRVEIKTKVDCNGSSDSNEKKDDIKESSVPKKTLLLFFKDVYFAISVSVFPLVFISLFLLYSSLPQYMAITFKATESQQGIVWISTLLGYGVGFIVGNMINTKCAKHRHILLTVITFVHGAAVVCVALMPTWWSISIPLGFLVSVHMATEIVLAPILTTIVEKNHSSEFGTMSGILVTVIAISVAFGCFLGPILLSKIGLMYMNVGVCIVSVIYAPFYLFLGPFCRLKQ